ncbi:unnamed protein product, partial [Musa hybrid cultivar]
MSWWGPSESAFWAGTPAAGLKPGSCHLEGCGGPRMGTGSPGTAAEVSPLLLFLLPLLALLSVIFLLAPSSGVVGGSALQSRAEVPKLEGCLSLLLRVWDSTTPCS